jgi:hypothetical protein
MRPLIQFLYSVVATEVALCPFGYGSWCDVKFACASVSVFIKIKTMKPAVLPAVFYRDRRSR